MDFDQTKRIEVEVSENVIAENEIEAPRKERRRHRFAIGKFPAGLDILDVALVPVILGVFVSLGFLFAGLFKAASAAEAANQIVNTVAAMF